LFHCYVFVDAKVGISLKSTNENRPLRSGFLKISCVVISSLPWFFHVHVVAVGKHVVDAPLRYHPVMRSGGVLHHFIDAINP
jgi:hypothetical protein